MAARVAVATRTGTGTEAGRSHGRGFWIALAAPGIIWLILLFVVPFYAVLAIAMGQLNRLFESPIAGWNPLHWSFVQRHQRVRTTWWGPPRSPAPS